MASCSMMIGHSAFASPGGQTYTPGNDQHLDLQGQIGGKTRGYSDCGRAAEGDLNAHEGSKGSWKTSPEINELIGSAAPEFADDLKWINSDPLTMSKLQGHPIFIRFWNRDCRMCMASGPLMNELYDDYAKDGLVVIGVHHSKSTRADTIEEVASAASSLNYKFPVALDNSWNTISRFWIHSSARNYSSASFLINKDGTIVWGHDLGRLEKGSPAALSLHTAIRKLISTQPMLKKMAR